MRMWLIDLFLHAAVGVLCAGAGQFLTGYSRAGCPISVLAGLAGSYAGPWAAQRFEWPEPYILPVGEVEFPVVTAAAGAFIFVVIVNLALKKRKF
jgi:uncharacterized membrane protein YeaQ/YmgE (transglycosylase-associated protein family)